MFIAVPINELAWPESPLACGTANILLPATVTMAAPRAAFSKDDGRMKSLLAGCLSLLIFSAASLHGGQRPPRDSIPVQRMPVSHVADLKELGPANAADAVLARFFNRIGPPLRPGVLSHWPQLDTMLDGMEGDIPFERLRPGLVCAADAVVFGVVQRQRVFFNITHNAMIAVHRVRITNSVRGGQSEAEIDLGTIGGRAVVGDDVYETEIFGLVPLPSVETLFFLDRLPASSPYVVTRMIEPTRGQFAVLGLAGARDSVAAHLSSAARDCSKTE